MAGLATELRKDVLNKMWVFSHGLAVLINNQVIDPMTVDEITGFLMDTGSLIIAGQKERALRQNPCGTAGAAGAPASGAPSCKK